MRRVVAIAVGAAVAVLLAWYLLLWSPANKSVKNAKARTTSAQLQVTQLQADITRLEEAQRNQPAAQAKLEVLRAAIPDDPQLGQFILAVNDAATKAGIQFASISPSEPRQPTPTASASAATSGAATTGTTLPGTRVSTAGGPAPAEIAVSMSIKGGYFQILDFMNRLDSMPRLVVTDSVNVTADPNGALGVGLTCRIFVRAVPTGFAGATSTTSTTAPAGGSTTTTAAGGSTTTAAGGAATTTTVRP